MVNEIFKKQSFPKKDFPTYPCPRCGTYLRIGLPDVEDRADTKQYSHVDGFSYDDERSIFNLKLECSHPKCGEPVFVVGHGSVEREEIPNDHGDWEVDYVTWFEPKYFIPHLRIFKIPKATPCSIIDCVNASFGLLFLSSGSALNEVRNAVESLMDELKVPRSGLNDEIPPKEERWDLDKRVGKLSGEHRKFKQHLLAIKNLGNWGSHAVETKRQDVLEAYEILHYVLDGIYERRTEHVTKIAQKIKADKRSSL